jgi:hypothetical protein
MDKCPRSKLINGVLRLPVKVLSKGDGWVDYAYWQIDCTLGKVNRDTASKDAYEYPRLSAARVGSTVYYPRKKMSRRDARSVLDIISRAK